MDTLQYVPPSRAVGRSREDGGKRTEDRDQRTEDRGRMKASHWFLTVLLSAGVSERCSAGPLHAECRVEWFLAVSCRQVYESLVSQINKWSSKTECERGERCLYELQSSSVHFISAKHMTPVQGHVDNINFRLVSYKFFTCCHISAMSISETWYIVQDHGTNYCNLYNLMEGSGLADTRGYREVTSDFLCTERSTANCSIY